MLDGSYKSFCESRLILYQKLYFLIVELIFGMTYLLNS